MICIIHRILCLSIFFMSAASVAGIQPGSTRVIYPAAKREVTLQIMNHATTPRLIQAWIDRGDSDAPTATSSPFFVTPPIPRINPDKSQTLRITFIGGDVPGDRESVFWLNILELQPKTVNQKTEKNSVVQFSIRTKLKVFYRPEGLPGKPKDAFNQVRWHAIRGDKGTWLECDNKSVFNVSFQDIQRSGATSHSNKTIHGMCPAKVSARFDISNLSLEDDTKLSITTINDYGGFNIYDINYEQPETKGIKR